MYPFPGQNEFISRPKLYSIPGEIYIYFLAIYMNHTYRTIYIYRVVVLCVAEFLGARGDPKLTPPTCSPRRNVVVGVFPSTLRAHARVRHLTSDSNEPSNVARSHGTPSE